MEGHYEKVDLKEPFYSYMESGKSSEKGGIAVSDNELIKLGINPKDP